MQLIEGVQDALNSLRCLLTDLMKEESADAPIFDVIGDSTSDVQDVVSQSFECADGGGDFLRGRLFHIGLFLMRGFLFDAASPVPHDLRSNEREATALR